MLRALAGWRKPRPLTNKRAAAKDWSRGAVILATYSNLGDLESRRNERSSTLLGRPRSPEECGRWRGEYRMRAALELPILASPKIVFLSASECRDLFSCDLEVAQSCSPVDLEAAGAVCLSTSV